MEVKMKRDKMNGMVSLSQFSAFNSSVPSETEEPTATADAPKTKVAKTGSSAKKSKEKPVSMVIELTRDQQQWLSETAQTIRDNNINPVPAGERVFPRHLISVAVDLLHCSDVELDGVLTVEDLRKKLGL